MKRIVLLLTLALSGMMVQAQFWVTSVLPSPDPAQECVPVSLAIEGQKPGTNYNVSTATASVSGSVVSVTLILNSSGIGLPVITPFSGVIPVGSLGAGTYSVEVSYQADGNIEFSAWPLDVLSCGGGCSQAPDGNSSSPNPDGSVSVSWNPDPAYQACRVRGRVLGSSSWSIAPAVTGSPPSAFTVPAARLVPGQTYEWQVQCACSLSPLVISPWSVSDTFTAPLLRTKAEPELLLMPNPVQNTLLISGLEQGTPYQIADWTGRIVQAGVLSGPISLEAYPMGWYAVVLGERSYPFLKVE
jgi:hypothetical protein